MWWENGVGVVCDEEREVGIGIVCDEERDGGVGIVSGRRMG